MNASIRTAMVVGYCSLQTAVFGQEVYFSRPGGTFVEPFALSLSAASSNAVIRYVLVTNAPQAAATQTNVPTESSPLYSGPIVVNATTLICARAFEQGRPPGPPASEAYIQISPELAEFGSDLPLVLVHNFGQGPIISSPERSAVLAVFDTPQGRNAPVGVADLVTRAALVDGDSDEEVGQLKVNLQTTFWDEFNRPAARSLLDMPADSEWLFWGINGFDPGMMHNAIFHWFGRQTGRYSSRTRYVEVFLKTTGGPVTTNDYSGVYLVEELPKRSPARINIAELAPQDTNAPVVSGGYVLRIDRVASNERTFAVPNVAGQLGIYSNTYGGQSIIVSDPNSLEWATDPRRAAQRFYIADYFTNFIRALTGPDFTNALAGYAAYIDVDSWIDHHLVNTICFNVDAFRLHSYLFKERGGKIELGPPWDCDRCLGAGGAVVSPQNDNRPFNPRQWRIPTTSVGVDFGTDFFGRSSVGVNWWDRLFRDPDFWQRWIDRYQELRAGPIANAAVVAMVDDFFEEIREAQPRDQARWSGPGFSAFTFPRSGNQTLNGYSYDFGPRDTRFARGGFFTNEVNFQKQWLMDRLDFMDTNFLARPVLSQGPGLVSPGTVVTVTNAAKPGSMILYTLDGTDPRLPGGGIAPGAKTNLGDLVLTIDNNVGLVARSYNPAHANLTNVITSASVFEVGKPHLNSIWSGPVSATYQTATPPLRVSEVMYHAVGGDKFDFIEVKNISAAPLNLGRFRLRGDVRFDFPQVTLGPGEGFVVVAGMAEFLSRYGGGVSYAGPYSGNLPDDRGRIILQGPVGEPILDFTYRDDWEPITDGFGFSLVAINDSAPVSDWQTRGQWRPSSVVNGTPGSVEDPGPSVPPIYVNELLAETVSPSGDAIELFNPSAGPVNIGGWFLTDDMAEPNKYRIPPDTLVPANGYLVFRQADSFGGPASTNSFEFSPGGDAAYVLSADAAGNFTGWMHGFAFGPHTAEATSGRHVLSTGEDRFVTQSAPTLGAPNAGPLVGPVVISEINYHPPAVPIRQRPADNTLDEFIEVQNISGSPVTLAGPAAGNPWRLRGSASFAFPPGTSLPPGGFLLVVGFNPADTATLAAFRATHNVPAGTPIVGPWSGSLNNAQGNLELVRSEPSGAAAGQERLVLRDAVDYRGAAPWPSGASGTGASITRVPTNSYGNDPASWRSSLRTPGTPNLGGPAPVITVQPADAVGIEGATAIFTVTGGGASPLGYQWLFNGMPIYGAVNPELTLAGLRLNQAGGYACVVFGTGGTIQSRTAALVVRPLPRILGHPQPLLVRGSTNEADYGFTTNNASFNVTATGTGSLQFQWRFNGVPIPGATGATLTISNVSLSNDGLYEVTVTDDVAGVVSRAARLTVLLNPVLRVTPPPNISVVAGAPFTVSATVSGNPLPFGFEWRQNSSTIASNTVFSTSAFATFLAPANLVTAQPWRLIVRNAASTNLSTTLQANYLFYVTTLADADGDGIPDDWEAAFGFNPTNNVDRNLDSDGDGAGNHAEYIAGTNPTNALSYLRIEGPELNGGAALVRFFANANQTYAVEASDTVTGPWNRIAEVAAVTTNRVVTVTDRAPNPGQRVYRLVTPRTN